MNKKKLLLTAISIPSFLPIVSTVACGKTANEQENNGGKSEIDPQPKHQIEYKTKTITLAPANADEDNNASFLDELRAVRTLGEEYNKIALNINLGNKRFSKTLSRDDFNNLILPIADQTITLSLDESGEREQIEVLSPTNKDELDETASFLKTEFNNYRVPESWFVGKLEKLVRAADSKFVKNGRVSRQKAIETNKTAEYDAVVNEVKEFLKQNALLAFADNIDISEFNYNKNGGWSLKIKLRLNDIETDFIKLDFQKPKNSSQSEEEIKAENKKLSFTQKIKSKINEKILESNFATKLLNKLKVFKIAILIDDNKQFSASAARIMSPIATVLVKKAVPILPRFLVKKVVDKLVIPSLTKLIAKIETKAQSNLS
ncbi:hypothetical protein [Mycoplasma sp. HS2188]|uniref:hypothetical protein n=1 Tax=Mycoplasma sp. HS2188 TaxID=2976765 RepID=UPI0021AA872D|nr:hypothetical protein [Mycoplasma sp. HS2188]MCT4469986.1 hypothetical protein [Mycoplasma sp. HS2188]